MTKDLPEGRSFVCFGVVPFFLLSHRLAQEVLGYEELFYHISVHYLCPAGGEDIFEKRDLLSYPADTPVEYAIRR